MRHLRNIFGALAATLLFPGLICRDADGIWTVALFGVLILLFYRTRLWDGSWQRPVISHGGGLLFALMTGFGCSLEVYGAVPWGDGLFWLSVLGMTHVFARVLVLLWELLQRAEEKLGHGGTSKLDRFLGRPWLVFPVILLLWLPCWLATWPGNFVYDATKEWKQLETGFLGDFPMLHSVLITKLLAWSKETTGAYNTGIAVFTGGQMLLLAAMFTHMLWRFYRLGANRYVVLGLAVYCAAFPGIHVLATSTVRDVLFSGLLTYSVFLLWNICRDPKAALGSWWRSLGAAVTAVLTVYARNNNSGLFMPLVLVAVALLLFLMGGKKGWKGAVSFGAAALAVWFSVGGLLSSVCDPVAPASGNASLTFYSQSLGRAYSLEGENWPAADQLEMMAYFNMKGFRYTAECGDSTKGRLRLETPEEEEAFKAFWAKIGKRHPDHYADAILINTRAAWFPGAVMDGYQKNKTQMYADYEKCWFFYADLIEEPGVLDSKLPAVHDWYRNLSLMISYEKVPLVSQLFSVGFHFWLLLFACLYALYRRARHLYLPLAILLGYMVISMLVPLMILRYFGAIFFAFPMVCLFILQPGLGTSSVLHKS